ncbi:hypothetical protein BVZ79_01779 [Haemophilus influenzae]|nr:hypothetical protein BVZ79_01779 [Haemophilus influenzae]PRL99584.1 hypothetical protein BV010_00906 [Haemophilus influenzae]PRM03444.1 hypothetical protein BV009_00195 [Haemophilus influenzae]
MGTPKRAVIIPTGISAEVNVRASVSITITKIPPIKKEAGNR